MVYAIQNGKIIAKDKILEGYTLYFEGEKILAITKDALKADEVIDAKGLFVSPGFVDTHTHGAAGFDFLDGTEEAFLTATAFQAKHGATTVLPTITSANLDDMSRALKAYERVKDSKTHGAHMPGVHLEGPYFAAAQAGAQDPKYLRDFTPEEYNAVFALSKNILRWSAAPELAGAEEFARVAIQNGCLPCIGHSDAEDKEVRDAFEWGFTHITHFYSGCSMVHRKNAYRYTGVVEEGYLNDGMTVEIIADGCHLPASLLKLICKVKGTDNVCLVTDSMRAAGMPEGPSIIGSAENGMAIVIEDGVAKLPDRSAFAGSVATSDRLVRNMVQLAELPLTEAVKMAATTPARIFGLTGIGELKPGYDADILLFNENIDIEMTFVKGNCVFSRNEK
ncbi:MAG: N-acetylglucosamine-6-phosphate deacetylase [Clostridia bacterium]|nr:N-acetylglucosamine-6-phosphate deacetylase [Clostridia bacterium]